MDAKIAIALILGSVTVVLIISATANVNIAGRAGESTAQQLHTNNIAGENSPSGYREFTNPREQREILSEWISASGGEFRNIAVSNDFTSLMTMPTRDEEQ